MGILKTKVRRELHAIKSFISRDKHKYSVDVIEAYNTGRILYFDKLGDENSNSLIYYINFGDDPKKMDSTGFFTLYLYTLEFLDYAERFNLKPYVNWGKGTLYSDSAEEMGTSNAFEYYFQQLNDLTYESVNKSCYVKSSYPGEKSFMCSDPGKRYSYTFTEQDVQETARRHNKYIKLNRKTKEYIDTQISQVIGGKKTVAVHVRGTDYKQNFIGHPVAVTAEEYLGEAIAILNSHEDYEQVFLATDDSTVLDLFKKELGEKLVYYKDVIRAEGDLGVHWLNLNQPGSKYRTGLEVLRDAYTMASCDSLVAGLSRVSFATRVLKCASNTKFDVEKILDKGLNSTGETFASAAKFWSRDEKKSVR